MKIQKITSEKQSNKEQGKVIKIEKDENGKIEDEATKIKKNNNNKTRKR